MEVGVCTRADQGLATIEALAPTLSHLARLASRLGLVLQYNLYLTSPSAPLPLSPQTLPSTTTLSPYRPEIAQLVREALPPPPARAPSLSSVDAEDSAVEGQSDKCHGGLAVIACGPEGIIMEARNAVAGLGIRERVRCGGIEFHGETYAL